jgi:hypothetical protein
MLKMQFNAPSMIWMFFMAVRTYHERSFDAHEFPLASGLGADAMAPEREV